MVKMKLLMNNDEIVVYQYQPEESGEFGEIELNKITEIFTVRKLAENDKPEITIYRSQVQSQIVKCFRENKFPEITGRYWG